MLIKSNIQIQQSLKKLENDQKEIMSMLRNSDKVIENVMDGHDHYFEISDVFPLRDLESFENVETHLKDVNFKKKLVSTYIY